MYPRWLAGFLPSLVWIIKGARVNTWGLADGNLGPPFWGGQKMSQTFAGSKTLQLLESLMDSTQSVWSNTRFFWDPKKGRFSQGMGKPPGKFHKKNDIYGGYI